MNPTETALKTRTAAADGPSPEKRGRIDYRRGQRAMQHRASEAIMKLAPIYPPQQRQLLARAAEAILKLEIKP